MLSGTVAVCRALTHNECSEQRSEALWGVERGDGRSPLQNPLARLAFHWLSYSSVQRQCRSRSFDVTKFTYIVYAIDSVSELPKKKLEKTRAYISL